MRISDEKIEEVRAAADILEVVGDYVKLKRRGSNYFGLSPFKDERTPSFSVHPGKGIFKCFSTGIGGDVFSFLRQMENVTFLEAVRMLADRYGVPLPQEEPGAQERANETETVLHALRFAGRFFYHQLTRTQEGERGLGYLENRGFTRDLLKAYGVGYAPDTWDALLREAEAQHILPESLEKAGLVIRKDNGSHYDRYRGRVMFPIFSHVGKVVGFGGRILTDAKDQPKYVNSPETIVYSKGRVLYGLYQGRQELRRTEEALLVEGYTDVLSLHQAGILNAVATCGTALTPEQVKLLSRYCKRIILLYDADSAGANAAVRGVDTILENWKLDADEEAETRAGGMMEVMRKGLIIYMIALPPGEDPDSYVRNHGAEAFREYLAKHRQDFVEFMYAMASRGGRLSTPEGKAEVQEEIVRAIAKLPSPLLRDSYVSRASAVLKVPDIHLYEILNRIGGEKRRDRREPRSEAPSPSARPAMSIPEETAELLPEEEILFRLMLERGAGMVEFVMSHMGLEEFTPGPSREMAAKLLELYEEGRVASGPFLDGTFGESLQHLAAHVLADRYEPSSGWREQNISVPRLNEKPEEAATSAMMLLKLDRVDAAIELQRRRVFDASQGQGDLTQAQTRLMQLYDLRKRIERRAFLQETG